MNDAPIDVIVGHALHVEGSRRATERTPSERQESRRATQLLPAQAVCGLPSSADAASHGDDDFSSRVPLSK